MPFQIIRNDITKVSADAIVNTANPNPTFGGGTDSAIYEAAGVEELLAERKKIGNIERGQAVATPAFNLDAKYIIHTVGPAWQGGDCGEFDILRSCYENSLKLALELKCASIAFPLIATGVYGFPKDKALQIAMAVIEPFVMENSMDVILVVFDKKAFELSGSVIDNIREYVDSNYVEEAHRYEYVVDYTSQRKPAVFASQSVSDMSAGSASDAAGLLARLRMKHEEQRRRAKEKQAELNAQGIGEDTAESTPEAESEPDKPESLQEIQNFTARRESPEPQISSAPQSAPTPHFTPDSNIPLPPVYNAQSFPVGSSFPIGTAASSATRKPSGSKQSAVSSKIKIDELLAASDKTFQEKLFEIIDSRGLTGPQVYKNYISKQVYSKIQADRDYHPNKYTAIALCLSLHLDVDETLDLIGRAGWTLSPSSKPDLVVKGCIMNGEYNVVKINCILFDFDCPDLEKIK